ncbi:MULTISPECIES: isocitrate/isopropylmalate family dehydrogenase [Streptomyces]|uniref:isocitrate/isopropylmalate family dehydrogenase n=1 Tax=Streptomyces TaxID=1883 RepID=UPI0019C917BF|nr:MULTISPECIES: isocitrate/isopropylmalate family dehydrogenase [Streptomyces]WTD46784.1 isocitrate/isopropylmalate family dehydrogenase [Streptomyces thermoviolaceus]GGV72338.1 protein DlpA [Streptomyces thermoviolaceus subsp. apingens]GHB12310.1 protein DlpA [Streptomyces thermoviolaceus subsp. thermoviolaceus]
MKPTETKSVAVLPGDGIGPEVVSAALDVVDQLGLPLDFRFGEIGWECWRQEGDPVPQRTWKLLAETDTCLLGAVTSKPLREAEAELAPSLRGTGLTYVSPVVQLRQRLGLYANIRPVTDLKDGRFDFTVIRENTEGLYAGIDVHGLQGALWDAVRHHPNAQASGPDATSVTLRLQTRFGIDRLLRFGFAYAEKHGHHRLTLVDKPMVLRHSGNHLRERLELIARDHPDIETEILNVDAVALWMVRRPERFGVLVAENMFGDILSDLGAGVMGGLGLAPSGNIGDRGSYFEPVHGSAPGMAGQDKANPMAMLLTVAQMLDHLGLAVPGEDLRSAVRTVVRARTAVTYDLGGTAGTRQAARAVARALSGGTQAATTAPAGQGTAGAAADTAEVPLDVVDRLAALDTASISDALDSLGIPGVLTGITARVPGARAAGRAFTVGYRPVQGGTRRFRNAADYLDEVPAGSFVVIDNGGSTTCTNWGSLLTAVAQRRGVRGTALHGSARDIAEIRAAGYPLFSTGTTMVSGKNRVELAATGQPITIGGVTVRPGDIVVADDNGVLVVPAERAAEVAERAERVEGTEAAIAEAVAGGMRLDEARRTYGYARPWEGPARAAGRA